MDSEEPLRLSKRMAQLGICSRREADFYISRGWVEVNGQRAQLGQQVRPGDKIRLAPQVGRQQRSLATVLLHKPLGYVSGQAEEGYRPALTLIRPENRWKGDPSGRSFSTVHLRGLAPAGRLDINSTGLLVLTQDGRIARELIAGGSVEKEYLVRVAGRLSDRGLELLNHGLSLDGEALRPAKVTWQNRDQLRFLLRQGKKRQIRRMCELVGLQVLALKRVRIGSVVLGDLPLGQWRYLAGGEAF